MSPAARQKLTIIPFTDVEHAIESNQLSLKDQSEFNTKFHSSEEIHAALPNVVRHYLPEDQPWISLQQFLPLITSTQGYAQEHIHQICLPKVLVAQLGRISKSLTILGHVSESDEEDFEILFPRMTTRNLDIDNLTKKHKFFIRLDACSLKDALQGTGPARDRVDIWTRLATSARGMEGAVDMLTQDPTQSVNMWLLPWQDSMRAELEYRVFCPPPLSPEATKRTRISAISQYHWHQQWVHAPPPMDGPVGQSFDTVGFVRACEGLLDRILDCDGMTEEIRQRGFVFDVAEDADDRASLRLIELNSFGAMTGCGACLFHWIRDAEVLYGFKDGVEVRVTY